MRQILIAAVCALSLLPIGALASVDLHPTPETAASELPDSRPTDSRLKMIEALRRNDAAAYLESIDPAALQALLSEDLGLSPAEVADKIAEGPQSDSEQEFIDTWTLLRQPDGVARTSALWYPSWQAYVPQALASAQMGLVALGEHVASSTSLSPLERMQLTELQWALTGWMSRTDFSDRKHFEQVLTLARDWVLASGAAHPLELTLSGPEKRLRLADMALRSAKQAVAIYGLDADQILASVRMAEQPIDARTTLVRTSLTLFDAPISFEEKLVWFEGQWRDADIYGHRLEEDYDPAVEAEAAASVESALGEDPVFDETPPPERIDKPGCHAN
ncbi:MAG: hypothetical protein R3F18_17765 [Lysobacterales bacterium]|nr:hypothetical protein [Xanthomonadales bacterium]MCB1613642.1 hypothetical protein [Xanthomonadales bacterium]MCP5475526.1 hypothetical protein [Rhodanobacteraceae bacterium]